MKKVIANLIDVEVEIDINYEGLDKDFESEVEKLVGEGHRNGSGYGFCGGIRDIQFGFDYKDAKVAQAHAIEIHKMGKRYGLTEFSVDVQKTISWLHPKWLSVRTNIRIDNLYCNIASWATKNDGMMWDFGHADLN